MDNSSVSDNDTAETKPLEADTGPDIAREPSTEEDIPADFFDAFSNQEFMAGLDVVDMWDTENKKAQIKATKDVKNQKNPKQNNETKPKLKVVPYESLTDRGKKERYLKSKSSSIEKRSKDNASDSRRDPLKTKRDILKDKDKRAKDKEAKIICEKLKIAETGLVPPGTEMDVDLNQFKGVLQKTDTAKPVEKSKKERSRNRSVSKRELLRKRSPLRVDYRYRRYSRSPYLDDRRSPYRKRLDYRGRNYSEERRRDHSIRKREYSPTNSEREFRLREKRLSPIRRSSYRRKRSISRDKTKEFLEDLVKYHNEGKNRKIFVEESRNKINESAPPYLNYPSAMPNHIYVAPAPPNYVPESHPQPQPLPQPEPQYIPQHVPQQYDIAPQYDQEFFIGQSNLFENVEPYSQPFVNNVIVNPSTHQATTIPVACSVVPLNNLTIKLNNPTLAPPVPSDNEDIAKLFEEKKISLSDFLSISAKNVDPKKPINVQKKIKVISLCQDAVKALDHNSSIKGRFFLQKSSKETEKQADTKFRSPLRKIPVVRFTYTTPSKNGEEKLQLCSLNKVLISLGLTPKFPKIKSSNVPVVDKPKPTIVTESSRAKMPVMKPQVITKTQINNTNQTNVNKYHKFCQTDYSPCPTCEIRSCRKFVTVGVQCGNSNTANCATQITEEDLQYFGRYPGKNQSLSHLTSAQLLAGSMNIKEPPMDSFVNTRIPPSSADGSPEKKFRNNMYGNNYFPPPPVYSGNSGGRNSFQNNTYQSPDGKKPRPPFQSNPGPRPKFFENRGNKGNYKDFGNASHWNPW